MRAMLVCLLMTVAAASAQEEFFEGSGARIFSASDESDAEIIRNEFLMDDEGGYSSEVETSNQITQTVSGESLPGEEPETGSFVMRGEYSYVAPDGRRITVVWFADETGYHPTSDALPVAPEA